MAATGRRSFLALLGVALRAETSDELRDIVAQMATSLSAANESAFFHQIDKKMPGYNRLREQLIGLMGYAELSSSVDIRSSSGDEQKQTAKLDWYMSLKSRVEQTVTAQRRETLTFDFEKRGKRWMVTRIEPQDFFKAP